MNITKVTITGADDRVNPHEMAELSREYPFLEWGILFSGKRQGQSRCQTDDWISDFAGHNLPSSAHFCGMYAQMVIEDGVFDMVHALPACFRRVQLNHNFGGKPFRRSPLPLVKHLMANDAAQIILQYNRNNELAVTGLIDILRESGHYLPNLHFLYDESGGRGKVIDEIKYNMPIKCHYTGFAGGMAPDNVVAIAKMINEHPSQDGVWIDMESGVRTVHELKDQYGDVVDTCDELSLDKCREVLEKVKPFIMPF